MNVAEYYLKIGINNMGFGENTASIGMKEGYITKEDARYLN